MAEREDNLENEDQGATGESPPDQDFQTVVVPSMNEVADYQPLLKK